jgi:hypothetical protein
MKKERRKEGREKYNARVWISFNCHRIDTLLGSFERCKPLLRKGSGP